MDTKAEDVTMAETDDHELAAMGLVLTALKGLSQEEGKRVLDWVRRKLGHEGTVIKPETVAGGSDMFRGVGLRPVGPKQFLTEKKPRTDVERVACLAYYLAHY